MCGRLTLLLILTAAWTCRLAAQSEIDVTILKVSVDINTTEGNVGYRFDLRIDTSYFEGNKIVVAVPTENPRVEIRDLETDQPLIDSRMASIVPMKRGAQVQVEAEGSEALLDALKSGGHPFYISLDKPMVFVLSDGQTRLLLSPAIVKQQSASTKLSLPDSTVDELVQAKGGYLELYGTKFDATWRFGQPDSATGGYLTFDFVRQIFPGWLSRFGALLSSRLHDVATHVTLSPVVFRPVIALPAFITGAYEFSQDGLEQRVSGAVLYQDIIPNLVDLSGGYNRLRLKPIARAGVNAYYYTKSPDSLVSKKWSVEPFLALAYYVPILEHYSIMFNGDLFWRSDKDFKFLRGNAVWHGDVSLNYEIPGAGTKVMAKYSFGVNSLTFEKDDKLLLGVLVDFIEGR